MKRHLTAIALILVTCGAAGAQTTSERLMLERTAAARDEVVVAMDDRRGSIRGTLVDATEVELELRTRSGPRFLDFTRVVSVDRPGDPIFDGVLRGMGAAATWCALTCQQDAMGRERPSAYLGRMAVGAAIGGFLDSRRNGGRTLYRRGPGPRITIDVARQSVEVGVGY